MTVQPPAVTIRLASKVDAVDWGQTDRDPLIFCAGGSLQAATRRIMRILPGTLKEQETAQYMTR